MSGGRRALVVALVLSLLAGGAVLAVRWALGPDNLARVITGWVERHLDAHLVLAQAPGVRLIPRLQLSLADVRLERDDELIASAGELRVALPWSALWSSGLRVESLHLRRPAIDLPALAGLLRELSDPDARRLVPTLPRIAVGIRVEEGSLLSGADAGRWRLDRISLVTTPLQEGELFHLDAGARIQGGQSRTVSLTLNARPVAAADHLAIRDIDGKLVISPDHQPLDAALAMRLHGRVHLDGNGLALVDLDGDLPGWPDWLPNVLGFQDDQPALLSARWLSDQDPLVLNLTQGEHILDVRLDAGDLNRALELLDRPLLALAALRGQWRLDALDIGEVRIEGIRLDVAAQHEPASEDDAGDDDHDDDDAAGNGSGNDDSAGDAGR